MYMKYNKIIFLLSIIVALMSCTSIDEDNNLVDRMTMAETENVGNCSSPYSMDIMSQAYDYIRNNSTRGWTESPLTVTPTHRYIKFSPTNRYQVDALNECFTLYTFPLDSIPRTNTNEIIDAIDNDGSLYAMVDYNAILPDSISFTELGILHNPYDSNHNVDIELTDEITKTAFAIAMYGDASMAQALNPWRPSGTIRVYDDIADDFIPLEGLHVYISHPMLSVPYLVVTDEYGYFEGNIAFSDEISYIIQWKGEEWAIKFNDLSPAVTISYSSRMPLDLAIAKQSSATYIVANTSRAMTFYWDIALDFTPPTLSRLLTITCHDSIHQNPNVVGVFHPNVGLDEPIIETWCKDRESHEIISTTMHELAHAAHFSAKGDKSVYNAVPRLIKESWAKFVVNKLIDRLYNFLSDITGYSYTYYLHEDLLTMCDEYQCFIEYTPDKYNIQAWRYNHIPSLNDYSPLFIDMIDGFNQREWYANLGQDTTFYPNDNVRIMGGAGLIEDLVFNNQTLAEIKEDLIQYISTSDINISTEDINDLFEIYEMI